MPPALTAWDRWNYQRSDYLAQPASAKQVPAGVYGAEALDQHGTWRTVESYGSVWVPAGVAPGWSPYSTGRWIWDPRFGWSWVDTAPWGWAPYHYGRWVHLDRVWAWAPGPVIVRPVYAPALVAFFGIGRLVFHLALVFVVAVFVAFGMLVWLAFLALFMGVFSPLFTRTIEPSVDALVRSVKAKQKVTGTATAGAAR